MIRYSLKCRDGHAFDGWFASSEGFEVLAARGQVACAVCGGTEVGKAMMAPSVGEGRALAAPTSDAETKLSALRRKVESTATYVGGRFAEEARRIHEAEAETAIYGEANASEVRALLEDGIPVAPLPFVPKARVN